MKRRHDDDDDETDERNVRRKLTAQPPALKFPAGFDFVIAERFWTANSYIGESTPELHLTFQGDWEGFKQLIRQEIIQRPNVLLESDNRSWNGKGWLQWWHGPVPNLHLFDLGPRHPFEETLGQLRNLLDTAAFFDAERKFYSRLRRDPMVPLMPDTNFDPCLNDTWVDKWQFAGCKLQNVFVQVPPSNIKQWTRDCIDALKVDLVDLAAFLVQLQTASMAPPLWKLISDYVGIDYYGCSQAATEQFLLVKNYLPFQRFGIEYAAWTNNLAAARLIIEHTANNHMASTPMSIASLMGHKQFCDVAKELGWSEPRNGGYHAVDKFYDKVQAMSPEERNQNAEKVKKHAMVYFMHTECDLGSKQQSEALAVREDYLY